MATKEIIQIEIPDFVTVRELSDVMQVSPINIIKELMKNGIMANINQQIDFDTASIIAEELGYAPVPVALDDGSNVPEDLPLWREIIASEKKTDLVKRPPVVTVLGHVDHGKTSLLDVIRKESVADGEAGGITQHIGAYQAKHDERLVTFLDTPGHAAFTSMRARGAQATDIAILVVAADDGLMPQTREAIDHAKAANVPIVVAMNKMDLASANPHKVMQQLADVGLTPDEWEGDTLVIPVSAKMKTGIDDLLEAVLLTADEIDPKANPETDDVTGVVLEARMERGKGVVATILVQNGTLQKGDTLLIDRHYGRIKAMYDYKGRQIKEAGPSTPISVSGLDGMPGAGERFEIVESEKLARRIVDDMPDENELTMRSGPSLEDIYRQLEGKEEKTLPLIIKADVQGSLEPIVSSLEELSDQFEEISIDILRAATGSITESDVMLASASEAIIMGFNVKTDSAGERAASSDDVEINNYKIIYHMFDDVEKALKGMLDPVYEMRMVGTAEVLALFRIKGVGNVAGCRLRKGMARRKATARVIRTNNKGESRIVKELPVSSLRHHQDKIEEISGGREFGLTIQGWDKFRENDMIEFHVKERVDRYA